MNNQFRILVVEKDPGLANSLRLNLVQVGFEVLTATDVWAAQEIFQSESNSPRPIDFLLIDQETKGIDGLELIEGFLSVNPCLKIILTAGDENRLPAKARLCGLIGILSKPFTMEQLLSLIVEKPTRPITELGSVAEDEASL